MVYVIKLHMFISTSIKFVYNRLNYMFKMSGTLLVYVPIKVL